MMQIDAVLGVFNAILLAVVGFFLKETWHEIHSLRDKATQHATSLAEHDVLIEGVRSDLDRLYGEHSRIHPPSR